MLPQRYLLPHKLLLIVGTLLFLLQLIVVGINIYHHSPRNVALAIKKRALAYEIKSGLQVQVTEEFCSRRNLTYLKYKIPDYWKERYSFFRHILVDDNENLLFAYLPKVASSHIRRFVCVLTGVLPENTILRQKLTTEEYRLCLVNSTFLRGDLTNSDRIQRLNRYWKVAILRNPLHRLVSAYRDKIIGPELKDHEKEWSHSIMQKYNKTTPDFESYLKWIIDTPHNELNEHFAPMIDLLQPCRVDYHYYGNFKDLSEEMSLIASKLQVPKKYFVDEDYYSQASKNRTGNFLKYHFSQVSSQTKAALFRNFYDEFEFYYNLFPEENGSHTGLLGITDNVASYAKSVP